MRQAVIPHDFQRFGEILAKIFDNYFRVVSLDDRFGFHSLGQSFKGLGDDIGCSLVISK